MDSIKKILNRYSLLGWPLVSLVISALLLVFIIVPQVLGIKKTNDSVSEIKQRAEKLDAKAAALSAIDTTTYQANLKIALTVLPEEKDIPAAIGQIQSLVSANKLKLLGINFARADNQNTSATQSYQIKIDISGDQQALKNFINSLKEAPLLTKLANLEVTGSETDNNLDSTLTLSNYYQTSPSTLGDLEKPLNPIPQKDIDLLTKLQQRVQNIPLVSSTNSFGVRGKSDPFQ